jgi:predicted nucleotidyltransferase component of viral defense system
MNDHENFQALIEERLKRYETGTDQQLLNAAKEIFQEIVLLGLSRRGFFKQAAFHGGTALRLMYGLDRFSEDLDFTLHSPQPDFSLTTLLNPLREETESWGLAVEVIDRSKASSAARKAFVKETSLGAELKLKSPLPRGQKLVVKIELDVNPPLGAIIENKLCEFPTDFYVSCHNLPSLFAGKLHALLCRSYLKGRDWYDLGFYLSRKTVPNFVLLLNALKQSGGYKDAAIPDPLTMHWIMEMLRRKINQVDFAYLKQDVMPFVRQVGVVDLWSREYFLEKTDLYLRALSA